MNSEKWVRTRLRRAIQDFNLIEPGDRIAIGVSGGKDSMALLYLLANLKYYRGFHFSLVPIHLVLGWESLGLTNPDLEVLKTYCSSLSLPLHVETTQIAEIVFQARQETHPCSLCAKMRKGVLHDTALQLGCNKIALGHHFDDVIETVLMGMLYGGQIQTMMPKLHSANYAGMELIRPMYMIKEADIIAWARYNDLSFIQCACRFTENCTIPDNAGGGSKRQEMKKLIKKFRQTNRCIDMNIFNSIHSVNLETIIGYRENGHEYSFLDHYDDTSNIDGSYKRDIK